MKVKVSGPMTKVIKQALGNCRVTLEKMSVDQYRARIDYDVISNEIDYDNKTGMMKAILIEYQNSYYYAMPRYLTTRELTRIFRNSDHTMTGFIDEIRATCAI